MNVKFNGLKIDYPHGFSIECDYYDDDMTHLFHIIKDGVYVAQNYVVLSQTHERVLHLIEELK